MNFISTGLALCGHNEFDDLKNQGNFLWTIVMVVQLKDIEPVTLKSAPNNFKLIAHDIKKDTVNCIAIKIINIVIK